jgi:hypothetical protein
MTHVTTLPTDKDYSPSFTACLNLLVVPDSGGKIKREDRRARETV